MTRPLRIGFVAGEYPPQEGGLGDYTRELACALLARGHGVQVVTTWGCRAGKPKRRISQGRALATGCMP